MFRFALLALALALSVAPALARQAGSDLDGVPSPVMDTFEDGAQRLRLVGLASEDGTSLHVTLVYEDAERKIMRSIEIDPATIGAQPSPELLAFLSEMDEDFVSFVKASLADRFLHLEAQPSAFERAESSLFFPRAATAGNVSWRSNREGARLE